MHWLRQQSDLVARIGHSLDGIFNVLHECLWNVSLWPLVVVALYVYKTLSQGALPPSLANGAQPDTPRSRDKTLSISLKHVVMF